MNMKAKSGSGLVGSLLGGFGLLLLAASVTFASDATGSGRQVAVTLNAGETYLIKDLDAGATPAVHVLDNPNALVVNSDKPGELALQGESAGKWKIDVETAAGNKVSYKVEVAAMDPADHNPHGASGAAPASANFGGAADKQAKPAVTAALDAGSGPVVPTSATAPKLPTVTPRSAAVTPKPVVMASAAPVAASGLAPTGPRPTGSVGATAAPHTTLAAASGSSILPPVTVSPGEANEGDSMETGVLMPRQHSQGPQVPVKRFRNNPSAGLYSESVNGGTHYLPADVVELSAGSSAIYDFPRRIRRISIADTTVADIQVVNPFQINLIGHKEGFTTLAVWDTHGRYEERQVRVDPFGRQQVMLNVIVAELNRSRLQNQGINWALAFRNYNVSILGLPSNLSSINQGEMLPSAGGIIPLLESTNVNYALAASGQGVDTQTFFSFLENHNLGKVLAEPHLLANSGEKAEFLSGGEIPIVLAQALNTSIVFKQFGTSVIFVPTVIGRDDIELEVKPEVSQPDFAHGVSLFGFTVPAFITRRAQTFVRLKNNQTLIIAGLLLRTKTSTLQKTPYLGDIPYLGYLFKSTTYQDQESDLVMTVTPQIVAPIPPNGQTILPTEHRQWTADDVRTKRVYPPDASRPRF
jgi:Flp pilus assembly secretin CpaC